MSETKPYIIVVGNEKGGTGKSTISMHIITSLLNLGFSVGSVDIDSRQGTLSRYIINREMAAQDDPTILMPTHFSFNRSMNNDRKIAEEEDNESMLEIINELKDKDFIIFDTPGSDNFSSRLAHSYADTLITPINDSFVDLDLLVHVENGKMHPSVYSEMVWNQKKNKAIRQGGTIDWIVVRNRLSNLNSRNKSEIEKVLKELSKRLGFRVADGFSERVIFKELFLKGVTVLDIKGQKFSMSHLGAKQELRNLLSMIPVIAERMKSEDEALFKFLPLVLLVEDFFKVFF